MVGAITPWNFPHQINFAKLGPALAAGLHRGAQAGARHAVVRRRGRPCRRRADRHPGRRAQRRELVGPRCRGAAHADPRVDLVSFTGSTEHGPGDHAQRGGQPHQGVPGARRQVGLHPARRRRRGRRPPAWRRSWSAPTPVRAARSPPACWSRGRSTTRWSRRRPRPWRRSPRATRPQAGVVCGPVISARQRERIEGYLTLANEEGGTFAGGGGRSPNFDRGFFIDPTLRRRARQLRARRP